MEEKTKIIFNRPNHIPSTSNGVELIYGFTLNKNGQESEYKIEVLVDRLLVFKLGYEIWKEESDYYIGLMKLILPDVICEIKRRYYWEILDCDLEYVLEISNSLLINKYASKDLPEVEGFQEYIL